ncbi:MAG TPA: metallophosphoesterase, partial [Salinimicrobium sp.]|nr:metallophosphoesterase [Salinimicrobium sp.]
MRWFLFICVYILLDIYSFQAFRTLTRSNWLLVVFILFSALVVGNFIYQWTQPTEGKVLSVGRSYAIGFLLAFMVAKIIVVLFLFGEDLFRFFIAVYQKIFRSGSEFSLESRRKFVSTIALGVAAVPFASLIYGMYQGKYNYRVVRQNLFFDDLPEAFDGYKIIQISDVHSGSLECKREIEHAIKLLNEQEGDIVLFTGDLVNNMAAEMTPWMDIFSNIKAKDGVFSVLGNHDYGDYVDWKTAAAKDYNLSSVKEVHKNLGWNLLLNESRFIERDGQRIALIGVENWGIGGFKKAGDIDKAAANVDASDFKVLMSHDPSYWQEKIKS